MQSSATFYTAAPILRTSIIKQCCCLTSFGSKTNVHQLNYYFPRSYFIIERMSHNHTPLSKTFKHTVALFILALFIQGCGERQALSRVSTEATILASGDSLTAGVGADKQHSYPSVLARLSGRKVVNAGLLL